MSAFAYMTGIARRDATPPTGGGGGDPDGGGSGPPIDFVLPWDEPFDQADLAELRTLYLYGYMAGDDSDFPHTGDAPVVDSVSLSGGQLVLQGSSDEYAVGLKMTLSTANVTEYWGKFEFEIAGADFDGHAHPFDFYSYDAVIGEPEADVEANGGAVFQLSTYGATGALHNATTLPRLLPVGSYTFIVCVSVVDGTHYSAELWINASPGDPATVSRTHDTGGSGFNTFEVWTAAPMSPDRSTRASRYQLIAGDRASDPFSIL